MYGQHRLDSAQTNTATPFGANQTDKARLLESITAIVEGLDLSAVVKRLMESRDGPKWSEAVARHAENRYRRFLCLAALYPEAPITPTREIDTVWHEHILNTRAYTEHCQVVFGKYLHHDAGFGADESEFEAKAALDAETAQIYERIYGERYFESPAVETAHCTIPACISSVERQLRAGAATDARAHCTIPACISSVEHGDREGAFDPRAHCTIPACISSVEPEVRAATLDARAHCTIPACISSVESVGRGRALDVRAHCTIPACISSVSGEPLAMGDDENRAHCTIPACISSVDPERRVEQH